MSRLRWRLARWLLRAPFVTLPADGAYVVTRQGETVVTVRAETLTMTSETNLSPRRFGTTDHGFYELKPSGTRRFEGTW